MKYVITVEGKTYEIELDRGGRVWINNEPYDVDLTSVDGLPEYSLLLDHRSYETHVEKTGSEEEESVMVVAGHSYRTQVTTGRRKAKKGKGESAQAGSGKVKAPLPGLIVSLPVEEGQQVEEGDVVAVLESMKMNLELRAPRGGIVEVVHGVKGVEVKQGDILVVLGSTDQDKKSEEKSGIS